MASLTTQQIAAADFSHDPSVEHSPSVDKPTSFDGVTLTFHWVTVMLVLGLFTTAIWHALSHDDVLTVMLLRIHREAVLFSLHRVGAWALGLLITAHALNALVHHFIIRDNTLARMAPVLGTERGIGELALERGDSQTSFGR